MSESRESTATGLAWAMRCSVVPLAVLALFAAGQGCGNEAPQIEPEPGFCGDGVVDPGEDCDGDDLAGASCASLGFHGGELSCTVDCTFEVSGCLGDCGTGTEICEGACTDLSSCTQHCGACGVSCFPRQRCSDGSCVGHVSLSPEELHGAMQEKDFMLVNVRVPPWGMIPGTDANVSDEELDQLVEAIGDDLGARVVVYCRTNPRSINAINQLSEIGYSGICWLLGGVEAWIEAGYELD